MVESNFKFFYIANNGRNLQAIVLKIEQKNIVIILNNNMKPNLVAQGVPNNYVVREICTRLNYAAPVFIFLTKLMT